MLKNVFLLIGFTMKLVKPPPWQRLIRGFNL